MCVLLYFLLNVLNWMNKTILNLKKSLKSFISNGKWIDQMEEKANEMAFKKSSGNKSHYKLDILQVHTVDHNPSEC